MIGNGCNFSRSNLFNLAVRASHFIAGIADPLAAIYLRLPIIVLPLISIPCGVLAGSCGDDGAGISEGKIQCQ